MSLNKNINNFTNRFFEDDANNNEINNTINENVDPITISKEINFKKEKVETRSKQVHCFMKPSLYKKIKTIAKKNGISCNEVINRILENTIE